MAALSWNQDQFNRTLREYLARLDREKIPNALNKKAYFLARRAVTETPKKDHFEMVRELAKVVTATRKDKTTGIVPVVWAMVAKRAAKKWPEHKITMNEGRIRKTPLRKAWLRLLKKTQKQLIGARGRALGFMRLGWWSTVMLLAPHVRNKAKQPYMQATPKLVGRMKGRIRLARQSNHSVTIENLAHAAREKRGGFIRIGSAALDRAFSAETKDMTEYMEREALKEQTAAFNRQNRP